MKGLDFVNYGEGEEIPLSGLGGSISKRCRDKNLMLKGKPQQFYGMGAMGGDEEAGQAVTFLRLCLTGSLYFTW